MPESIRCLLSVWFLCISLPLQLQVFSRNFSTVTVWRPGTSVSSLHSCKLFLSRLRRQQHLLTPWWQLLQFQLSGADILKRRGLLNDNCRQYKPDLWHLCKACSNATERKTISFVYHYLWCREADEYLEELGVDLKLRYGASLLLSGLSTLLDALEEMVDGAGDDAQLFICDIDVEARPHRVRLPWTGLRGEMKMSEILWITLAATLYGLLDESRKHSLFIYYISQNAFSGMDLLEGFLVKMRLLSL